jgi:hypothetical protein
VARFYREFLRNYFDEAVSETASFERVAACVDPPTWADTLRLNRHDILHFRAPWLRFEIEFEPRKYEAILVLEYRLDTAPKAQDEISLGALKAVQWNLRTALDTIRNELLGRVRAMQ